MTFGDRFRAVRSIRGDARNGAENRKQVRDMLRAFQLRNDGSPKETRPTTKETA